MRLRSFAAAWRDDSGASRHWVTAYSGQYRATAEEIDVVFLALAADTPLRKGTGISWDVFTRPLPA